MNRRLFRIGCRVCLLAAAALLLAPVAADVARAADAASDLETVSRYHLNDRVLSRYAAVIRNLVALQKRQPDLARKIASEGGGQVTSIADVVAKVNKYPELRDAITAGGMTVKDYVVCSYALIQTAIYAAVAARGDWSKIPSGVPTQNVRYYLKNRAKFDQLNQLINQLNSENTGSGG